ncbi:alpha-mannosidase [Candidatus Moduliflexus flocculans]|uniref:alpha-mannosidase n=1 Tax=Candidatus Moduliflexus flocculans TaxID=1499966 RepID=A0A081BRN8_9BACT|nr:alpha-mannosidase [Candidatus Moduliflexus flocculans]
MYHATRWTIEKIGQRIKLFEPLVYRRKCDLPPFRLHLASDTEPEVLLISPEIDDSAWPLLEPHTYWGDWRSYFTLRTTFQCPTDWQADAPIAVFLPLGDAGDFSHPEALAYIDGVSYAACDRHHQEFRLSTQHCDGKPHALALHGWTGMGGWQAPLPGTKLFMRPCQIVQIDQPTRDFLVTARVALGTATSIDANHPAKGHLLNALDDAFKQIDSREPFGDGFYASIPAAHATLKAGIAQAGDALDVGVVATGHAHIDVAWLWQLSQTRKKAGRTFHTVLRLMEQFPDYHFTQSQPQLYDYVRQDYPELFEGIKARVAEKRWEAIGGMWVEADCNLTGAESLARQFLLGRTFFREHFGAQTDSPVLWLPDVFGYAWNLPQLIKQAGLDYFFTIKIGWSQYNRLPYDSFWWQGLDGTKVLTHFSTTPDLGGVWVSTYNAEATPLQNLGTWKAFQQKEMQRDLLMLVGYGDGGGGPTREMLENIHEMADFPAVPRMRQEHVGEFFRKLERDSGERLPVWNGELYLEYHRGTYTTQSRNKRANRKSEFLLHDAEWLATLAMTLDASYVYPADTLSKAWQFVCLNQFHDIIPGSSIGPVYADSLAQYEEIRQMGERVKQDALAVMAQSMSADLLIVNPTSFEQTGLACYAGKLPANQHVVTTDGKAIATQAIAEGTLLDVAALPPFSAMSLRMQDGQPIVTAVRETTIGLNPIFLENRYLRVEFNAAGDIVRIFDKANQREVLPQGACANQFLAFEDRPKNFDAWDIDIFYEDKCWFSESASSITVADDGALRVSLEIKRQILNSAYTQRISLDHNSPCLRFDTRIDWRERHVLLKTAFPVAIFSPTATYEIQWGNVERPTHWNTSWDWARFETCAQKWVDLSEGDYGVSLLNDCKYGHDIRNNVIRLSLLRSPTEPDPEADQGEHRFVYSLLPHAGKWGTQTIAAAYALNDPFIVSAGRGNAANARLREQQPFIAVNRPNIVIETIKRAEDGNGLIVRFYESQRQRGEAILTTAFPIASAELVNILEETQADLPAQEKSVSVNVTPYQIVTLRIVPKNVM